VDANGTKYETAEKIKNSMTEILAAREKNNG
jgi:hypothetical protein